MNYDVIESFYKDYFANFPKNFDSVFILHANCGEIYDFIAYLAKPIFQKYNTQKPLFIATKPYHTDIASLFLPDVRCRYQDLYLKEPRLSILNDYWEYEGFKFQQIFSPKHFNAVNSNPGCIHYFDAMLKTLDLKREDVSKPSPIISKKLKNDVIEIAKRIDLNIDNFIILAPEALTSSQLPISFWKNLSNTLRKNGYDVFLNITNTRFDIQAKTHNLSFSELFALATMSKGAISLRSGLSEFLIPSKAKNIILCTKFHWSSELTAEQCIKAYSVYGLPFVNKKQVQEINVEKFSTEIELIKYIMEQL